VGAYGLSGIASHSSAYLKDKLKREGMTEERMKSTMIGRLGLATLNKAQNSTFDIRNTGGFQSVAGVAGLNLGRSTSLTYAQKKQVGDREKDAIFDSLKTKEQKIDYINSIVGPGVMGNGPMHPVDMDADARRLLGRMKFNERQELIAEASRLKKPGAERMLKRINADLGEENYSKESILAQYKALEGDPAKQAKYLSDLRTEKPDANGNMVRARTDEEMYSIMKDLTETNRAEVEANLGTPEVRKEVGVMQEQMTEYEKKLKDTNLGADERVTIEEQLKEIKGKIKETDYGAIATINREVFEKLKPRQQELAKAERRNFERDEQFREIKTTLKEKIKAYDLSQDATIKEQIRKDAKELVGRMGDNKIATMDEEDLSHEAVAGSLSRAQIGKILRTSDLNETHREKIYKSATREMKEFLKTLPAFAMYGRATDEQHEEENSGGGGI
jgi:hypothetical protein